MPSPERAAPPGRAHFRRFLAIPTRWMDNDSYGHVNNVVYYSNYQPATSKSASAARMAVGTGVGRFVARSTHTCTK